MSILRHPAAPHLAPDAGTAPAATGTSIEPGPAISRLQGQIQHYAWGSDVAIAALQARTLPTARPEAELWFGAHEAAPSLLLDAPGSPSLDAAIVDQPLALLGAATATRFGGRLPFLLKVLAAARPLSLQVHPGVVEAVGGCAAEDRAGIPRAAADRCFRDPLPKPELLRAVTPFAALCGFRSPATTIELLRTLQLDSLSWLEEMVRATGHDASVPAVGRLLRLPATDRRVALAQLRTAIAAVEGTPGRWHSTLVRLRTLLDAYPDDAGVLVALLLELIELAPGEAMFVPPGTPHAYLEGVGVEVMAASDNVQRGGLTSKHVDVEGFLALLGSPETARPATQVARPWVLGRGHAGHRADTAYFALDEYRADGGSHTLPERGPAIVLCLDGQAELTTTGLTTARPTTTGLTTTRQYISLAQGEAAFVPGTHTGVRLTCTGTTVMATPGAYAPHVPAVPLSSPVDTGGG